MKLQSTIIAAAALLGLGTMGATAADTEDGKKLHEKHCTACHGSEVYTRADHRMKSLPHLEAQVSRCTRAAGVNWSDKQIQDVVQYLNSQYYQF